jgi:hypothetical protein
LAEFFNISRSLLNKTALGTPKFPFRLNQHRLDMLNLMARLKAEKANQTKKNPIRYSPSFVQTRLVKAKTLLSVAMGPAALRII